MGERVAPMTTARKTRKARKRSVRGEVVRSSMAGRWLVSRNKVEMIDERCARAADQWIITKNIR